MSDEKVLARTYDRISTRVLNRTIKKREQQIANAEAGNPTSKKTVAQLRYELEQMLNALLERSMTKDTNGARPETVHQMQTDEKCD
jgi:hypothetical protein